MVNQSKFVLLSMINQSKVVLLNMINQSKVVFIKHGQPIKGCFTEHVTKRNINQGCKSFKKIIKFISYLKIIVRLLKQLFYHLTLDILKISII